MTEQQKRIDEMQKAHEAECSKLVMQKLAVEAALLELTRFREDDRKSHNAECEILRNRVKELEAENQALAALAREDSK